MKKPSSKYHKSLKERKNGKYYIRNKLSNKQKIINGYKIKKKMPA